MATQVFGNINVGLLFGLLQFVSTFVITMYLRPVRRPAASTRPPSASVTSSREATT